METQTETPEQKAHLDSVVHSGVDAMVLGCLDKVGVITYREALAAYEAREQAKAKMAAATIDLAQQILSPRA
jgi:hypothetical protein